MRFRRGTKAEAGEAEKYIQVAQYKKGKDLAFTSRDSISGIQTTGSGDAGAASWHGRHVMMEDWSTVCSHCDLDLVVSSPAGGLKTTLGGCCLALLTFGGRWVHFCYTPPRKVVGWAERGAVVVGSQ